MNVSHYDSARLHVETGGSVEAALDMTADEIIDALQSAEARYQFAIDTVHDEARWQWAQHQRGMPGAQIVAQRMGVVEMCLLNALEGDVT